MTTVLLLMAQTQEAFLPLMIASALYGVYQNLKANSELKMGKRPNFKVDQAVMDSSGQANERAKRGFDSAQMAGYKANIAGLAEKRRVATADPTGLAGVAQKAVNYGNLGAYNNLAIADANQKDKNIQYADRLTQYIQGEHNRATGQEISNYDNIAKNLGIAASQGAMNVVGAANFNQAMDWQKNLLTGKFGDLQTQDSNTFLFDPFTGKAIQRGEKGPTGRVK